MSTMPRPVLTTRTMRTRMPTKINCKAWTLKARTKTRRTSKKRTKMRMKRLRMTATTTRSR